MGKLSMFEFNAIQCNLLLFPEVSLLQIFIVNLLLFAVYNSGRFSADGDELVCEMFASRGTELFEIKVPTHLNYEIYNSVIVIMQYYAVVPQWFDITRLQYLERCLQINKQTVLYLAQTFPVHIKALLQVDIFGYRISRLYSQRGKVEHTKLYIYVSRAFISIFD